MSEFRTPPLFAAFRGYRAAFIPADLIAGLTLAAIAIPEQMATAKLGALPPQMGFFAFVTAAVAFAIFGSSRPLSVGADSTITPIFAGGLALLAAAGSPHYPALAAALALMVGILVAGAGFLRMGWIGSLLSAPVTLGFLAGIAVHIAVSQLPAAMGVSVGGGSTLAKAAAIARLAPHANLAATAIAAGVVAIVAIGHRLSPRLPGALLAVVLASLVAHGFAWRVALLGSVPGGLPRPALPAIAPADVLSLAPLALIVALVVMVQTAATAKSFPPPGGGPDENGDFVGLGAANLLAGFCGAFPVNASPPRTAIVAESGGRSQLAGLAAAGVVIALLVAGMRVLAAIPEAALAGILLFVAARIVRVGEMVQVARASPIEAALIVATAAAIIVLPIEIGVAIGIGLSLLHGLWSAARMKVRPLYKIPGASIWWPLASGSAEDPPGVAVVAFQAPLSFLNADQFREGMLEAVGRPGVKLAVLEAAGIIDIDFTAAQALKAVMAVCRQAGVAVAIARLESVAAQKALARLGLRDLIGADHLFESVAEAVAKLGPNS